MYSIASFLLACLSRHDRNTALWSS